MSIPRLIISGLSGGAGKTLLSLGLARAFAARNLCVRAFKKGPDYIDAAWLALASRGPQGNLDPFFSTPEQLRSLFSAGAAGADIALVEGNRGLFDGLDISGSCSTAELSRILYAPVVLVLDCTKMTRTAAALVKGCMDFEPGLHLAGVVLNRTGGERHRRIVRQAVEELCGVPVLGVLPRRGTPLMAERHTGLYGTAEYAHADALLDELGTFIADHVDLPALLEVAGRAEPATKAFSAAGRDDCAVAPVSGGDTSASVAAGVVSAEAAKGGNAPRIGYIKDAAFWFYYRENLEALRKSGAEIFPLSLLDTAPWPEIDGLYIGGGTPELYAKELAAAADRRAHVAALAAKGLPIYAECGGAVFLGTSLRVGEEDFSMAGVFPLRTTLCAHPRGLGYVEARVCVDTPYFPAGTQLRGHEFHSFACSGMTGSDTQAGYAMRLVRGSGMASGNGGEGLDGLLSDNVFAAFTYIYAPAAPGWADAFVACCRQYRCAGKALAR